MVEYTSTEQSVSMEGRLLSSNLNDRLAEFHSILQIFKRDVNFPSSKIAAGTPVEVDSESSVVNRSYVRAVFALIEGVLDQHRLLLLCLHDKGEISLKPTLLDELQEQKAFLRLREKSKAIAKAYNLAFRPLFKLTVESHGWEQFLRL